MAYVDELGFDGVVLNEHHPVGDELRRYQMLRFGSFVGFRPPYFYIYPPINRLHRVTAPAMPSMWNSPMKQPG